ncbi:MAG: hypothetical protein WC868_12625 [Bacteroidales bacterium]
MTKAYLRRTKGDYDSFIEFDTNTINEMFSNMKEFIKTIECLINDDKN